MIVLDTQALIWLINNPEKISKKARKLIDKEIKEQEILVSSITVWEIFLLLKKDKLRMLIDPKIWLEEVENRTSIKFVPVDNQIAASSVNLPDPLHKDPADRIIIATALQHGATIITSDKKILDYSYVRSVW